MSETTYLQRSKSYMWSWRNISPKYLACHTIILQHVYVCSAFKSNTDSFILNKMTYLPFTAFY